MRVLVDRGKREGEGRGRNTTDENGEERGGAREMEIGYENVLVFHWQKGSVFVLVVFKVVRPYR